MYFAQIELNQAFFSPDPEDADLIRATLSAKARQRSTTLDLPSLQAWLRARLDGRRQPPTLIEIEPLVRAEPSWVGALIREAIVAHSGDYFSGESWQEDVVRVMRNLVPDGARGPLDKFCVPIVKVERGEVEGGEAIGQPDRPLGE